MDDLDQSTEAGVVAELTRRAMVPEILRTDDGRAFLLTPKGMDAREVTDPHGVALPTGSRIIQQVEVQTLDSLVEYVNRFKTPNTILLADVEANRIVALLDFHRAAETAGLENPLADYVSHRVTLRLPFSVEWGIWTDAHGKLVDQQEFAQFIEENACDVAAPSGADLLEVAQDIRLVRSADFRRAVRASGQMERFEFSETEEARTGAGIEVPARFELSLPVYFGHRDTELYAFLRFKKVENVLRLGVALNRSEDVRQAMFREIVLDAGLRTDRPAMFGKLGTPSA